MVARIDKDALIGTCVRLPISIDLERLRQEVTNIPPEQWGEHRADVHQQVSAIFLKGYAPEKRMADDVRPILEQLPYIQEIIYDLIPGEPAKCLLADLRQQGAIAMHRDGHIYDPNDLYFHDYFSSTMRIHIPITTNEQVLFFCNGRFFNMPAGEVWTINNLSDHAVINAHPTLSRIHMIVDMHPDQVLMELVKNGERMPGDANLEVLAQIMETSCSPEISPYSKGKPIPA